MKIGCEENESDLGRSDRKESVEMADHRLTRSRCRLVVRRHAWARMKRRAGDRVSEVGKRRLARRRSVWRESGVAE